jgi:Beta-glucosidase-related glycosidases
MGKSVNIPNLLSKMTTDEKIGQTNMLGGSIYHDFSPETQNDLLLKGAIGSMMYLDAKANNALQKKQLALSKAATPILFCGDNIHGVNTIFPNPLGETASFDPEMAEKSASIMALEQTATGARWNFSPMSDISRDARWGRNIEGAGEDPLLAGDFVAARVRGLQGQGPTIDSDHVASTIKHFAGYSLLEAGEEYQRVYVNEGEMNEFAFPVYQRGIEAGASSVMLAFNDLDGVPCTANESLIKQQLRAKMGFGGVVVSDYGAVGQLVTQKYSADEKEAVYDAFTAGLDIDMESRLYVKHLKSLIGEGRVSLKQLDETVGRILNLKNQLGLFEHPYADEDKASKVVLTEESLAFEERVAIRSAVLLKNNKILPLSANDRFVLMGPLADDAKAQNGSWSYDGGLSKSITYRQALCRAFPQMRYAESPSKFKTGDTVVYIAGIPYGYSGEAASLTNLDLPAPQKEEIKALKSLGLRIILVVNSARVLTLSDEAPLCEAVVYMWAPGTRGGNALAKLLFGVEEPTGHLPVSFPRHAAQCPLYYNRPRGCRPFDTNNYYTSRYLDSEYGPLFPFGFGLSYEPSLIKGLMVKNESLSRNGSIEVSYEIENLSARPIRRLAQFYASPTLSRRLRPDVFLVAYQWTELKPFETKFVSFAIPASRLARHEKECGSYSLFIGESSASFVGQVSLKINS